MNIICLNYLYTLLLLFCTIIYLLSFVNLFEFLLFIYICLCGLNTCVILAVPPPDSAFCYNHTPDKAQTCRDGPVSLQSAVPRTKWNDPTLLSLNRLHSWVSIYFSLFTSLTWPLFLLIYYYPFIYLIIFIWHNSINHCFYIWYILLLVVLFDALYYVSLRCRWEVLALKCICYYKLSLSGSCCLLGLSLPHCSVAH